MDSELEEELKEREATVAEHHQAKRALSEMEEHITALKREKEDREREMEKLQVTAILRSTMNCITSRLK